MAIAALSWVNHVDSAVMTASDTAGDLAASNVANPIIGRRWRTTDLTAFMDVDFGADKTVELLLLRFPRDTDIPLSGTVQHQLDADGGTPGTGAAYDSGAVSIGTADGYGYHVHLPTSTTARYWRWTFNITGISWIDVGRAWAGEIYQPTRSISFGYGDEWSDLSRPAISDRSGAEFVDERSRQRVFAFSFDSLETADRDEFRELGRISGLSKQVVFVKDPTSPAKETILGRLAQTTPLVHRELPIHSKAFVIRESL